MIEFLVTKDSGAQVVYNYLLNAPIVKMLKVTIVEFKRDRSKEQNALFHMWCAQVSKNYYLTHGEHFSPTVWKEYFKRELLGEETLNAPRGTIIRIKRTRDLKVSEMSAFMERMVVMCAEEWNIILVGLET